MIHRWSEANKVMPIPETNTYLGEITHELRQHWPDNRTVNIVCHGHSVPAGYFATPMVDSLHAYPHLLMTALKARFPFAVVNVIVTAIGGEHSASGAARFVDEVLCHRPDVITVDYGLNDRPIGLEKAKKAWEAMIEAGTQAGSKMILLTPTLDISWLETCTGNDTDLLGAHAEQIRRLAAEHQVGLVDSFAVFQQYCKTGALTDLLSWSNHPNRRGHELVAQALLRWFPAG